MCTNVRHESFRFPDPKQFKVGTLGLHLPKFGLIPWVLHRQIEGTPKSVTISCDGGQWYAFVLCELPDDLPAPLPAADVTDDRVKGVDVGLVVSLMDDRGTVVDLPRTTAKEKDKHRRLKRAASRRKKGSVNRRKAKQALARFLGRGGMSPTIRSNGPEIISGPPHGRPRAAFPSGTPPPMSSANSFDPITPDGYAALHAEIDRLERVARPAAAAQPAECARAHGFGNRNSAHRTVAELDARIAFRAAVRPLGPDKADPRATSSASAR